MSVSLRIFESVLRNLVFGTMIVLGIGYVLVNTAVAVMSSYFLLQFHISSVEVVIVMGGLILFLLASATMMIVGVLLVTGGFRYYKGDSPRGATFLGPLLASFYLLCLGIGSALLLPEMSVHIVLLIIGSIFVMVGTAFYVVRFFPFGLIGSILGIIGGILLALVTFSFQAYGLAFVEWDVPFPELSMLMAAVEGPALILVSVAVCVYLFRARHEENPATYVLPPIATLVYGIGGFLGPLTLAFSLDHVSKAPWLPPLHGVPEWVISVTMLRSTGLFVSAIGGILLIASSYTEFPFVVFSGTRRVRLGEEFWPEEAEELSDHELMMKILNSSKGGSMKLDEIRDLLPTRTKLFSRIRPARGYVHKRLKKLVEMGFLQETGESEYKPIEKEEYFRRTLSDLLEKEGYTILEQLE